MGTGLSTPTQLQCSIVDDVMLRPGSRICSYVVTDANGIVVAEGASSNEDWVRHDAGGYHTKRKFDEMFPNGWQVNFNF